MSRIRSSEPAYPVHELETHGTILDGDVTYVSTQSGISVRTYIATHALAGLMASAADLSPSVSEDERMLTVGQLVAKRSVQYADALIAELNKTDS